MKLNWKTEKKLYEQGFKCIVGLDEAGRGPIAGPVVAAAVLVDSRIYTNMATNNTNICGACGSALQISQMKDSKKLSSKKRQLLYNIITQDKNIEWGRGLVGPKVIDKINIWEATKLAMKRAIKNLERKKGKKLCLSKTALIIDGKQKIGSKFFEMPIIKADEKIFACACASIIAKVRRDSLMRKYHKKYPYYNFARHKGYLTKEHSYLIKKYKLSNLHRKTFRQ